MAKVGKIRNHRVVKASGLGPSRLGADGLVRFQRRKALIANTTRPLPHQAFSEDA